MTHYTIKQKQKKARCIIIRDIVSEICFTESVLEFHNLLVLFGHSPKGHPSRGDRGGNANEKGTLGGRIRFGGIVYT